MKKEHTFAQFLNDFIPKVAKKAKQLHKAHWLLETTGLPDASDLKADLDTEFRLLFNDADTYQQLINWQKEKLDPIHARQLDVLIRAFKKNQIPKTLLENIAQKEAALSSSYSNFRANLNGKNLSENELRELLKKEMDPAERKKVWEASKEIGQILAPQILELVQLRNQAAHALNYSDYFQMELDLQEVDAKWLLKTFEEFAQKTDKAYTKVIREIEKAQSERFHVPVSELGPWAWSEPFCQEDPLNFKELDELVQGIDIERVSAEFYKKMGFDVDKILAKSDMLERPGKNQHAFCTHIDREGDVRTLNNVKPTLWWLEVVLHELGHGIYELGYDKNLPWLLREPPHMITTEAMALIAGRQANRHDSLGHLVGTAAKNEPLRKKAQASLTRRQLIFSRWTLVMTAFESELYRDPTQDLNALWWHYVEKYQKINPPSGREGKCDWAAKYHMGLAPVYYFSYLLGEMFASAIQESMPEAIYTPEAGRFLQEKLFSPGNSIPWDKLVKHVTGKELNSEAWEREFCAC